MFRSGLHPVVIPLDVTRRLVLSPSELLELPNPESPTCRFLRQIVPVVQEALRDAGLTLDGIDAVAGTRGPGLAGSLLVGYNAAKAIAYGRELPFLGVNHLEGHIYANWLTEAEPQFPALCLCLTGADTRLRFGFHLLQARISLTFCPQHC